MSNVNIHQKRGKTSTNICYLIASTLNVERNLYKPRADMSIKTELWFLNKLQEEEPKGSFV